MNTTTDLQADADRALKAKHRVVWALGDYSAVAREVIPELGRVLVAESRIGPGDRVLDVAAGTGNASIEAARTGASVVASDLTPELLEIGRQDAARQGASSPSRRRMPRRCPMRTTLSMPCSRASASCSRRITRSRPAS